MILDDVKYVPNVRTGGNNLRQWHDETLEHWYERAIVKAHEAFRGLPRQYVEDEKVQRFCLGALDSERAEQVLNLDPCSVEAAFNRLKRFKENAISMHGTKKVRQISVPPQQTPAHELKREDDKSYEGNFRTLLKTLEEGLAKMSRFRSRSRSRSPGSRGNCFICQDPTHFAADCPFHNEHINLGCEDRSHGFADCPKNPEKGKKPVYKPPTKTLRFRKTTKGREARPALGLQLTRPAEGFREVLEKRTIISKFKSINCIRYSNLDRVLRG